MLQHEHHLLKKYIMIWVSHLVEHKYQRKGCEPYVTPDETSKFHISINKDYTMQIGKKLLKLHQTPLSNKLPPSNKRLHMRILQNTRY